MFYIRVDANKKIASGHVMRCLTIALQMKNQGLESVFITADNYAREIIESQGFETICLYTKWNDLNGEIEPLSRLLEERNIDKLLIDSYFVTEKYLKAISRRTKIIYFDDLNQITYPVNTIINYSNNVNKLSYIKRFQAFNVKLILGSYYVPLRGEFQSVSPVFREKVKNILITTGGGDTFNIAGAMEEYIINDSRFAGFHFIIVAGRFNSNTSGLISLSQGAENISIYQDVKNMAELMLQSDIAVTAGGSTTYELCACEVPMITFTFADNQITGVTGFKEKQAAVYAGDVRDGREELIQNIMDNILILSADSKLRKELRKNAGSIVNKKGAQALVNEIN